MSAPDTLPHTPPDDRLGIPAHNLQAHPDELPVVQATRHWLEKAVIGLNLCPFAKAVHVKQQVRYVVSPATSAKSLARELVRELELLASADPARTDTTLLVHPYVLEDFLDYNDFLEEADEVLVDMGLDGEIQIASFHPAYQFEGTEVDDITNFTNRSPYPTLHLIRESSIEQATQAFPDAADIYDTNMATLRRLGLEGWRRLMVAP
ncbi:DUF1415 domain-containing protein [Aquabacterium lacunae]|uniref:DUF1415 domain-containing protein n=1 Tax=Aquabacterium lacunae TaxID=2528630 RepID=A0A4Q9GZX5_9BURK|nr:DUF1415 domain-containing protein [Aquabacterium lacunae]TBO32573.1 DUF1415 domain-containing protein [Aquabacterium lacunae]